jgi:branched-subunit amino acid permease
MARKNLSQKTALKTTVRLTMVAAAAAAAGLVMLLIVIFNLSNDEEGRAQSSMTFKQAITTQDTTRILRGSINQQIIGVMIETIRKGNTSESEFNYLLGKGYIDTRGE